MGDVGQYWDNAMMESFIASLRKELVHYEDYETREEAKNSLFEYVDVFYNNKKILFFYGLLDAYLLRACRVSFIPVSTFLGKVHPCRSCSRNEQDFRQG
jgi:hypothetical protein